jgi:hypothetical protein
VAPEHDRRVDDLREQLRALGYLDAPVHRFVLGAAARRERPAALAAAASVRIAMLAGLLLGPAAAVGLRWRAPGLVTGAADAVVLAVYLAVLFGVGGGLAAFGAILSGGLAARGASGRPDFPVRSRRSAATAGLVVGVACLLYLTFWWRAAIGAVESTSLAWTAGVVLVAAAISLLLGRAVTITVLAFLARLGLGGSLRSGLPLSSWQALVPLSVVAFVGAGTILVVTAPRVAGTSAAPALTIVPTGQRVVVVAIDGIDVPTLDRLMSAGRLPHLFALTSGATATMAPDADRDPARVWTTIATSQPPERHGIGALESRQVAGIEGRLQSGRWSTLVAATDLIRLTRPAIASGAERQIPAFWEVCARAGLRTAVVHWWATWPAPADLGVVLSDRAILRLERGGELDAEIAPASLYPALRDSWPIVRDRAKALAMHAVPAGAATDISASLARSAELDATVATLAVDPRLGPLDLLVLYLPGLDIAQYTLLGGDTRSTLAPSAIAVRVAALEQYYVFLDALVGSPALKDTMAGRMVVLVTEPGRVAPASTGLLAVAGPAGDARRASVQATDLGPTVLYALGVPTARDLAGRPRLELFARAFADRFPVRDVATFGSRQAGVHGLSAQPLDREMIERLKSLGYVRD